jgi:hypothetical protein
MKKLLTVLKNKFQSIFNCKILPKKHEETVEFYSFSPTTDITAFELYHCQLQPLYITSVSDWKKRHSEWYDNLPDSCRKYLTSKSQTITVFNYD